MTIGERTQRILEKIAQMQAEGKYTAFTTEALESPAVRG